jgi:hypothetical protein
LLECQRKSLQEHELREAGTKTQGKSKHIAAAMVKPMNNTLVQPVGGVPAAFTNNVSKLGTSDTPGPGTNDTVQPGGNGTVSTAPTPCSSFKVRASFRSAPNNTETTNANTMVVRVPFLSLS